MRVVIRICVEDQPPVPEALARLFLLRLRRWTALWRRGSEVLTAVLLMDCAPPDRPREAGLDKQSRSIYTLGIYKSGLDMHDPLSAKFAALADPTRRACWPARPRRVDLVILRSRW